MNKGGSISDEAGTVKSVHRAMALIEAIREMDGARIVELAEEFDLAPSTIHNHLSTLEQSGYLIKDGNAYQISMQFLRLGEHARTRRPEYEMAAKTVTELAEQSEERAQFAIEEQGRVVFLYRRKGAHAVNTGSEIGRYRYLHTSSVGKAILAHLSEKKIHDIITRHGLPPVTKNSITDETDLFEELEQIRERGYAVNKEENIEGLCAVGAPVLTHDGDVIGGLSVSGPSHRIKGDRVHDELADLVRGEANELELNIKYS